jgi:hypothetical protein
MMYLSSFAQRHRRSLVICLCSALAGHVVWNDVSAPKILLPNGQRVADLSASEVGHFAQAKFDEHRRWYLASLQRFETLPMVAIDSPGFRVQMAEDLGRGIRGDPANASALRVLPNAALGSLGRLTSGLLEALASGDFDRYELLGINAGASVQIPPKFLGSDDGRGLESAEPTAVHAVAFQRAYAADGGRYRLGACASGLEGVRCSLELVPPGDVNRRSIMNRLSQSDQRYFRGLISQASWMFRAMPSTFKTSAGMLVKFEFFLVVEDRHGDRYPLYTQWLYDASADTWWLRLACRQVSLRALNGPPMVF